MENFKIYIANHDHLSYASEICKLYEQSTKERGTGIAKRSTEYIKAKILEGKAIIALSESKNLAGFCYIESWGHNKYVANSGLIVKHEYRARGLAKRIKMKAFELSRRKFPESKLFGITTSLAVMKINSNLGYKPVTFSELTENEEFWKGCQSCSYYDVLTRANKKNCLCTGMLYEPNQIREKKATDIGDESKHQSRYKKWLQKKKSLFLELGKKNKK